MKPGRKLISPWMEEERKRALQLADQPGRAELCLEQRLPITPSRDEHGGKGCAHPTLCSIFDKTLKSFNHFSISPMDSTMMWKALGVLRNGCENQDPVRVLLVIICGILRASMVEVLRVLPAWQWHLLSSKNLLPVFQSTVVVTDTTHALDNKWNIQYIWKDNLKRNWPSFIVTSFDQKNLEKPLGEKNVNVWAEKGKEKKSKWIRKEEQAKYGRKLCHWFTSEEAGGYWPGGFGKCGLFTVYANCYHCPYFCVALLKQTILRTGLFALWKTERKKEIMTEPATVASENKPCGITCTADTFILIWKILCLMKGGYLGREFHECL